MNGLHLPQLVAHWFWDPNALYAWLVLLRIHQPLHAWLVLVHHCTHDWFIVDLVQYKHSIEHSSRLCIILYCVGMTPCPSRLWIDSCLVYSFVSNYSLQPLVAIVVMNCFSVCRQRKLVIVSFQPGSILSDMWQKRMSVWLEYAQRTSTILDNEQLYLPSKRPVRAISYI